MKRPYQITAVCCFLFAIFIAWQSIKLRFYMPMGPGPGFFPLLLSIVFGILAVIMFFRATLGPEEPMPADFFPSWMGKFRIAAIMGSLGAALILIEPLGFRLTMFAFFLFLLKSLGRYNLAIAASIAAAGSFGIYHLFVNFLKIPLPTGALGV